MAPLDRSVCPSSELVLHLSQFSFYEPHIHMLRHPDQCAFSTLSVGTDILYEVRSFLRDAPKEMWRDFCVIPGVIHPLGNFVISTIEVG